MNENFKIIALLLVCAIIVPLVYSQKAINWEPPRDSGTANVFQGAVGVLARFAQKISKPAVQTSTVPPAQQVGEDVSVLKQPPPVVKKFQAPQKPYRVLIIGDSFMAVAGGFGEILEQKLVKYADVIVQRQGKVSSGLSRPDYYDWLAESRALVGSFKPNVAIIMMGTNDAQSFEIISAGKKSVISYNTPEWDSIYLSRTQALVNQLAADNAAVYWIGLPAMRDSAYETKMRHVASLQEQAVGQNIQAKFISSFSLLTYNSKPYQAFLPDSSGIMQASRNNDGIHLSYFGGTYLAQKIMPVLGNDIALELKQKPADAGVE